MNAGSKIQVVKLDSTASLKQNTGNDFPKRKQNHQRRWNNKCQSNIDDILKEFGDNRPQNIALKTKKSPNKTGKSFRFTLDDASITIPTRPQHNPLVTDKTMVAIDPVPFTPPLESNYSITTYGINNTNRNKATPVEDTTFTDIKVVKQNSGAKVTPSITIINTPPANKIDTTTKLTEPIPSKPHKNDLPLATNKPNPKPKSSPKLTPNRKSTTKFASKLTSIPKTMKGVNDGLTTGSKITNYIMVDHPVTKTTSKKSSSTRRKTKQPVSKKKQAVSKKKTVTPPALGVTDSCAREKTVRLAYVGPYVHQMPASVPSHASFLLIQQGYLREDSSPPPEFIKTFYQLVSDNSIHVTKYRYSSTE